MRQATGRPLHWWFFRVAVLMALLAALGAALLLFGRAQLLNWSQQPINLAEAVEIELPRGASLRNFSEELEHQGLVSSARYFELWVRIYRDYRRFQAGLYRFDEAVSPTEIAATISNGTIYVPIALTVIVPEGYTLRQIAQRLAERGAGSAAEILALGRNPDFLKSQGIKAPTAEGYLFPATYPFSQVPTPSEALARMVSTFWQRLPADYADRVQAQGLSLEQAVIFASLIELETPQADEKPLVAEVIWRRLRQGAALGIDATIIYGLIEVLGVQNFDGILRQSHLRNAANPYNTRIHRGLPPTAIGSPGRDSLLAVLNPTNEGYYYYVLDPDDGRRHHFSRTLAEHNVKVRRLREAERRARQQAAEVPGK